MIILINEPGIINYKKNNRYFYNINRINIAQSNKNEIVSIEFKLKNWKQAIKQALDHKNGTDRSYICMPERIIHKISQKKNKKSSFAPCSDS